MTDEITQADVAPIAPTPPTPEVLKAREFLAARYDERGMDDASRAVRAGSWDDEPFMRALVDAQAA